MPLASAVPLAAVVQEQVAALCELPVYVLVWLPAALQVQVRLAPVFQVLARQQEEFRVERLGALRACPVPVWLRARPPDSRVPGDSELPPEVAAARALVRDKQSVKDEPTRAIAAVRDSPARIESAVRQLALLVVSAPELLRRAARVTRPVPREWVPPALRRFRRCS